MSDLARELFVIDEAIAKGDTAKLRQLLRFIDNKIFNAQISPFPKDVQNRLGAILQESKSLTEFLEGIEAGRATT